MRIYASKVLSVALLVAATAVGGCAWNKAYVRTGFLDNPPRRVAVLPFAITYAYDLGAGEAIPEPHMIGRDALRKAFYCGFAPYGYEDIKISEIDKKIADTWGPIESGV